MTKKELLIILILSFLYFFILNSSKIFAIDVPRVDEKAYRLCGGTGGKVVEGTKGRFEGPGPFHGFPILFVDCVCPDRTRQSLFEGTEGLEEWQGCRVGSVTRVSIWLSRRLGKFISSIIGSAFTQIIFFGALIVVSIIVAVGVKKRHVLKKKKKRK